MLKLIKNLKDNYSEIGFEQFYNKIVKNADFSCDNGNIIILVEVE